VREALKLGEEFVIHSLRHTMLTRLGEAGADVFTIMRIADHGSVTTSQWYVHPTPESMERGFERLETLNEAAFEAEKVEGKTGGCGLKGPHNLPHSKTQAYKKFSQVIELQRRALSSAG